MEKGIVIRYFISFTEDKIERTISKLDQVDEQVDEEDQFLERLDLKLAKFPTRVPASDRDPYKCHNHRNYAHVESQHFLICGKL